MDMHSSERAYPTQQDLQVFSTLFKVAGSFGRWGLPALAKGNPPSSGAGRRVGRDLVRRGDLGAGEGGFLLMRMTAASLQGLGPLAPTARMRTLIQLPTG